MSIIKNIALLGSTGSIGTQTLDVCRMHGIKPIALCAAKNTELLESRLVNLCRKLSAYMMKTVTAI